MSLDIRLVELGVKQEIMAKFAIDAEGYEKEVLKTMEILAIDRVGAIAFLLAVFPFEEVLEGSHRV